MECVHISVVPSICLKTLSDGYSSFLSFYFFYFFLSPFFLFKNILAKKKKEIIIFFLTDHLNLTTSLDFDNSILFYFYSFLKRIKRNILHVWFLRVIFIQWIYKCTILVELKESVNGTEMVNPNYLLKNWIKTWLFRRNKIFII